MRVPRSQRGGEIVEPLVREQWFVRMEPLAKPALEVRPGGQLRGRVWQRWACRLSRGDFELQRCMGEAGRVQGLATRCRQGRQHAQNGVGQAVYGPPAVLGWPPLAG